MSKPTKVPGIPKPPASVDRNTAGLLTNLIEAVEIRLGRRGDPKDRAVTLRELIDSGLAKDFKASPWDPNNPNSGNRGFGPNEIINTSIPPAPLNFQANAAYSQVNLSWDYPHYGNHSFTEIYGHDSDTIGDAQLIGVSSGRAYADPIGSGASRYYWIRFVSQSSVLGPFNSGTGTLGQTAVDVAFLLDVLTDSITDSQLAQSLSSDITGVATNAAAAAADATAAIAAKTAALLAQTGAETAEDSAVIAETNAETAQAAASNSANAASNSATGAAGSASSASTSETNAASSENNAASSATAASTSASNANTYATAAGTASTASQTAKVAAETAQTGAAASATAAATSESNASASESAAGTSASAADTSATNAASSASSAGTYSTNAASSATAADGSATAAASTVNGLTARLDNAGGTGVTVEQAYSANASDIGDLEAQYTVKIDANGAVAGFGLASTTTSLGATESEFIVNADRFAIMRGGSDSTAAVVPFSVVPAGTVDGVAIPAGVYMDATFIREATITAAQIGSVNADKISTGYLNANRIDTNAIEASKLSIDSNFLAESSTGELMLKTVSSNDGSGVKYENLSFDAVGVIAQTLQSGNLTMSNQSFAPTAFTLSTPWSEYTSINPYNQTGSTTTLPLLVDIFIPASQLKESGTYYIDFGAQPFGSISNSSSTSASMIVLDVLRKPPSSSTYSYVTSRRGTLTQNGSLPLAYRNGAADVSLTQSYDYHLKLFGYIKGFSNSPSSSTMGMYGGFIRVFKIHKST